MYGFIKCITEQMIKPNSETTEYPHFKETVRRTLLGLENAHRKAFRENVTQKIDKLIEDKQELKTKLVEVCTEKAIF